jgi:hypothetical protein
MDEKERLKLENVYQRVKLLENTLFAIHELLEDSLYVDLHRLLLEENKYIDDDDSEQPKPIKGSMLPEGMISVAQAAAEYSQQQNNKEEVKNN